VLLVLLIAALLAPFAEAFDSWDASPALSSDTEFNTAALALVAGLFAAVALVAIRAFCSLNFGTDFRLAVKVRAVPRSVQLPFFPGCSPPGPPLRI
jgi:hypothetical protein